MLRLNLILNNFAASLPNVVQGNTLLEPSHRNPDGTLKKFDFIVSNPPFKLDFQNIGIPWHLTESGSGPEFLMQYPR